MSVVDTTATQNALSQAFSTEGLTKLSDQQNALADELRQRQAALNSVQEELAARAKEAERSRYRTIFMDGLRSSLDAIPAVPLYKAFVQPVAPERSQELADVRARDAFPKLWDRSVAAARLVGSDAIVSVLNESGYDPKDRRMIELLAEVRRTPQDVTPEGFDEQFPNPLGDAPEEGVMDERQAAYVRERAAEYVELAAAERAETAQPKYEWYQSIVFETVRSTGSTGIRGLEGLSLGAGYVAVPFTQLANDPKDVEDTAPFLNQIRTLDALWSNAIPKDVARADDFLTQLGQGGGSMLAFLMASSLRVPVWAAGAATQGASQYEDALALHGTAMQRYMAFMLGLGLGTTEAIPIDRAFGRMANAYGVDRMARALSNTTASSLEEFLQEFGQTAGEDFIAKYFAGYDPERDINPRDWVEAAAVGGITGGVLGGGISLMATDPVASPELMTMTDAELQTLRDQAQQDIADTQARLDAITAELEAIEAPVVDTPTPPATPSMSFDVPFEIAPGRIDRGFTPAVEEKWQSLDFEQQARLTQEVAPQAFNAVIEAVNVPRGADVSFGTGAWMEYRNPSALASVHTSDLDTAKAIAGGLGYVLEQDEVWTTSTRPLPDDGDFENLSIEIMGEQDVRRDELDAAFAALNAANENIQGYMPVDYGDGRHGIRILVLGEGGPDVVRQTQEFMDSQEAADAIHGASPSLSWFMEAADVFRQGPEGIKGQARQETSYAETFRKATGTHTFTALRDAKTRARIALAEGIARERALADDGSGAESRFDSGIWRTGTQPEVDDQGLIELTHWSGEAHEVLDPGFAGTGPLLGAERRSGRKDLYFGVAVGTEGGYRKERGLGPVRHTVRVAPGELYNLSEDPLDLLDFVDPGVKGGAARGLESLKLVRAAGFTGAWNPNHEQGAVAVVFDAIGADTVVNDATGDVLMDDMAELDAAMSGGVAGLLADARARIAQKEADAARLSAEGGSIRFTDAAGKRAVAGPDMSKDGGFRLTYVGEDGKPSGHSEFDSLEKAVRQALDEKFTADTGGTDGPTQQTGDGRGRPEGGSAAALAGAPAIEGATGPDPQLVAVAEQYAADNGIPLKRQSEYVKIDPDRSARIAEAYDQMVHDPTNPDVLEAYQNLISQTLAQYRALVDAGYEFYFFDDTTDPYDGNPWNAMRDLRQNKRMGVYATDAGFGSDATLDVSDNPLLADTGLTWRFSDTGEQRPVLANDLFRAVHDAFGHGLEGSGFRAQGEENAWQAHVRLFTGSAVAALTSETRGQNSWLNFGPYGEANRTASVEDTVFADQKTGLMPEWTWTEGVAADSDLEAMRGTSIAREPYTGEPIRPEQGIPAAPDESKPVALRNIADSFIRLLNLTTRQGRFTLRGKSIMGQYDRQQSTVRIRQWDDVSTLIHEGGHALHDSMDGPLKALVDQYRFQLKDIASKFYGGDLTKASDETKIREGFAEFFRLYVTNRDRIQTETPDLVDEFDQLLRNEAPKLEEGLRAISELFHSWVGQSSLNEARSMVVDGKPPTRTEELVEDLRDKGFRDAASGYFSRFFTQSIVDQLLPLRQLTAQLLDRTTDATGKPLDLTVAQDPAKLAQLARNVPSKAMVEVRDGVQDYASFRPSSRSLQDALYISQGVAPGKTLGKIDDAVQRDFATYLVLRRALDEYRLGRIDRPPINMSQGEIVQALEDLDRLYGTRFTDAGAIVHEYGMALWQKQFDAGLIDKDTYREGLDRQFYAPLQRDMRGRQGAVGAAAQAAASSQPTNLNKRFRGSDRSIIDPLAVLVQKTFAVEQAIARNDVKKALANLGKAAGQAGDLVEIIPAHKLVGRSVSITEVAKGMSGLEDMTAIEAADLISLLQPYMDQNEFISFFRAEQASTAGENIAFYLDEGKIQAIQLADQELGGDIVNLVDALGYEKLDLIGAEFISRTSSIFRSAITKWPDFILVNFIRDQMQTWIATDVGYVPFLDGFKGIKAELWQTQLAKDYNSTQGIMGGAETAAIHGARVERDINTLRGKGYLGKVFEPGSAGFAKGMARLTEFSESGTRMGLWDRAYKRAKADGLTDYEAGVEAAFIATDVMDFGLNGGKGTLLLRRTIPFLNAQVQGLYKFMRTLGNTEVARRKGLAFALSSYFRSVDGLKLTRAEKQAVKTGRRAWAKMSIMAALSGFIAYLLQDDEDFQETSEYMRATGWVLPAKHFGGDPREIIYIPKPFEWALMSNFFERGVELATGDRAAMDRFWRGAVLNLVPPSAPPLLKTLVEDRFNENLFTDRDIIPFWLENEVARNPQLAVDSYTSEIAKKIGEITGWKPMVVDHYLRNLGASAFRDIAALTNAMAAHRGSLDKNDMPILRRFLRESPSGNTAVQDFWEFMRGENGGLKGAHAAYRRHITSGRPDAATSELNKMDDDERIYAVLNEHFKAEHKRLHPMRRLEDFSGVLSAMRREMTSETGLMDTTSKDDLFATIPLTKSQKTQAEDLLRDLAVREARNTLIFMGYPGWDDKTTTDPADTVDMLREISPELVEEMDRRMRKARVYDGELVKDLWPEVSSRLDAEGADAYLDDLSSIAKGSLR